MVALPLPWVDPLFWIGVYTAFAVILGTAMFLWTKFGPIRV